jgi:hypothetical protein
MEEDLYEIGHRSDDEPNPKQVDQYRENPNQGIVNMPNTDVDPTDLEWMD